MDLIGVERVELKVAAQGFSLPVIRSCNIMPATVPLDRPHFMKPEATYICVDHGYIGPIKGMLS